MANRNSDMSAAGKVYKAVKNGELPHISTRECAHCGKQAHVYHHDDYDKPLDVTPLCGKCHSAEHLRWWQEGLARPKLGTQLREEWDRRHK